MLPQVGVKGARRGSRLHKGSYYKPKEVTDTEAHLMLLGEQHAAHHEESIKFS